MPDSLWDVNNFLNQLQRANAESVGKTALDLVVTTTGIGGGSSAIVTNRSFGRIVISGGFEPERQSNERRYSNGG